MLVRVRVTIYMRLDKFIHLDFLASFSFFFLFSTDEYNERESRRIINTDPGRIDNWKGMLNPP